MLAKPRLKLLLKLCIGLALVLVLLSRTRSSALLEALQQYTPGAFLAALALTGMSMFIAGLRWKLLAPEISYVRLLKFTLIGQFYSLVLPGQLTGDAVKAWRVSRGAADGARTAVSVLADRITGLLALLLVSVAGIALSEDAFARALLLPVVVLTAGLALALVLLRIPIAKAALLHIIGIPQARVPRARALTETLARLVAAWSETTRDWRALVQSLVLGTVFQLIGVAIYMVLATCMEIELGWHYWMWIAGITAIALLLPVTLGGLGVREGTLVAILGQYAVPGEQAIALSLGLFSLSVAVALAGWVAEMTELRAPKAHQT